MKKIFFIPLLSLMALSMALVGMNPNLEEFDRVINGFFRNHNSEQNDRTRGQISRSLGSQNEHDEDIVPDDEDIVPDSDSEENDKQPIVRINNVTKSRIPSSDDQIVPTSDDEDDQENNQATDSILSRLLLRQIANMRSQDNNPNDPFAYRPTTMSLLTPPPTPNQHLPLASGRRSSGHPVNRN